MQAKFEEEFNKMKEVRFERMNLTDMINQKKIEINNIEMEIGTIKAQILIPE